MDKPSKGKEVKAQSTSEYPGPVGSMSGPPSSSRRSSCNWKNDGGEVGPTAFPRGVKTTGDLSRAESDVEVVNIRYRAIRLGNASKENAKNGIGLQTGKMISIIP